MFMLTGRFLRVLAFRCGTPVRTAALRCACGLCGLATFFSCAFPADACLPLRAFLYQRTGGGKAARAHFLSPSLFLTA